MYSSRNPDNRGTFWRLRRSLATSTAYAGVHILPEGFYVIYVIGNEVSYYIKKVVKITTVNTGVNFHNLFYLFYQLETQFNRIVVTVSEFGIYIFCDCFYII